MQFSMIILIAVIALIAGAALYIWAVRSKGAGIMFAKILGIIVMVVSFLSLMGSIFYAMGYSHGPAAVPGAVQNAIKQRGGHLEGRSGAAGAAVVNPGAGSRVAPAAVPNRSLNRELRRGGAYKKNH